jgi:hypothetical protein
MAQYYPSKKLMSLALILANRAKHNVLYICQWVYFRRRHFDSVGLKVRPINFEFHGSRFAAHAWLLFKKR